MSVVIARDYLGPLMNKWEDLLNKCFLHLFMNDITPTEEDDITSFEPAVFSGYSPLPLTYWSPAYINQEMRAQKDHAYVIFTYGPPGLNCNVYGYYITDYFGDLLGSERNPKAPHYMYIPGQTYPVRPSLTLRNEPPAEPAKARAKKC